MTGLRILRNFEKNCKKRVRPLNNIAWIFQKATPLKFINLEISLIPAANSAETESLSQVAYYLISHNFPSIIWTSITFILGIRMYIDRACARQLCFKFP